MSIRQLHAVNKSPAICVKWPESSVNPQFYCCFTDEFHYSELEPVLSHLLKIYDFQRWFLQVCRHSGRVDLGVTYLMAIKHWSPAFEPL
jgi:hypothetical protein